MNEDRFFLIHRGEIKGRFDPFYYIPSVVAMEQAVLAKGAKPLRSFIGKMASGATPKIDEGERFYSTKERGGVPFLRVQNLSETCDLQQDDLKYINAETHENYLKRSQVKGGNLLTKITGVGRMAVSSVAPTEFEGNINQHIVVSKTAGFEESEFLAAYLNSDIGERLATRRATGGTRPALDFPALRSIPIVYRPEIVDVLKAGVKRKLQKEQQARELFSSIDDYLLTSLGITLPPQSPDDIAHRMYRTSWRKVTDVRLDPFYHQAYFEQVNAAVRQGKLQAVPLKKIIEGGLIKGYLPKAEEKNGNNKVVQINCINEDGSFSLENTLTATDIFTKDQRLKSQDVLVVITGATIGKIGFWESAEDFYLGGDIVKFQVAQGINPYYIFSYLRSKPAQTEIKRNITGATNGHLAPIDVKHIWIPVPNSPSDYELIDAVADEAKRMREMAYRLQQEAIAEFTQTKKEIEKLIVE